MQQNVIIVGGGLAGLTASILLSKAGMEVLVMEKNPYPNHKVCGEYVSNEVRPLLEGLGLDVKALEAVDIKSFSLSTLTGKCIDVKLPLGGFGVSRYALDNALYHLALENGVAFAFETVTDIVFEDDLFSITSDNGHYRASVVLGCYGKRSNLDKKLHRRFLKQKSPWLGVKCHYRLADFPSDKVELHSFYGGYGGLSKTEQGLVNFCYLANYASFKKYRNIAGFNQNIVSQNRYLKQFLENAEPVFEKPLSIAQISFATKTIVENHVLYCGDSAGLIHPLCGNGMAMAIHAGKIVSSCAIRFLAEKGYGRVDMENEYTHLWKATFAKRLRYGRYIQTLLLNPKLADAIFSIIPKSQRIINPIIQRTHGKPILV